MLIFQPGEEGFAGAKAMIDDGLFERFPVQSVYGMHNWPQMRPGTVGVNPGPMMAAADRITIEITGRGGHGAHPYQTVDPVLVAAHIITAVQSIVSRNVKPVDSAVISLCAMHAGDLGAMSVVPGKATLVGTVRTFSPVVQELVERRLNELCQAVALGFGATASVNYERMYPATINTAPEAHFAGDVAQSLVGRERVVRDLEPSMGAEDFSFMLQVKPGAYLRMGQGERKRRRQLLPAQQPLRLQRRHPAPRHTVHRRRRDVQFCARPGDGSDMKSYTNDIKEVRKVNNHTVDFETKAPFPILPEVFVLLHHEQEVVGETTAPPSRWTAARGSRTLRRSRPTAPAPTACVSASPT